MEARTEIIGFAEIMEQKLKENDHKSHWTEESYSYLLERLEEEVSELKEKISKIRFGGGRALADESIEGILEPEPEDIQRECADVANFAMMIADSIKKLSASPLLLDRIPTRKYLYDKINKREARSWFVDNEGNFYMDIDPHGIDMGGKITVRGIPKDHHQYEVRDRLGSATSSKEWTQERVQKAFEELGFEMPETEEQLKAFNEKFKDYPHKLTGNEIDPLEILNTSQRK